MIDIFDIAYKAQNFENQFKNKSFLLKCFDLYKNEAKHFYWCSTTILLIHWGLSHIFKEYWFLLIGMLVCVVLRTLVSNFQFETRELCKREVKILRNYKYNILKEWINQDPNQKRFIINQFILLKKIINEEQAEKNQFHYE